MNENIPTSILLYNGVTKNRHGTNNKETINNNNLAKRYSPKTVFIKFLLVESTETLLVAIKPKLNNNTK